eukprot:CAMPEP_0116943952 /NCGR_PEP_ID=MMETSP0467-20121206/35498_1 /TAXON_ID=283647 /ORGANISM="Mesodinium pulex, Strain SPMC105" /LENGTH=83 /DNA_ID=CAMNT_0004627241 /DNA_START=176 /DNA_END=427 /DNA_ORIENTATION=-
MEKKRDEIKKRVSEDQKFIKEYDEMVAPIEKGYDSMTDEIKQLYENAKSKHKEGIDCLVKEMNYHPAYKRWDDEFTGIPFKPK